VRGRFRGWRSKKQWPVQLLALRARDTTGRVDFFAIPPRKQRVRARFFFRTSPGCAGKRNTSVNPETGGRGRFGNACRRVALTRHSSAAPKVNTPGGNFDVSQIDPPRQRVVGRRDRLRPPSGSPKNQGSPRWLASRNRQGPPEVAAPPPVCDRIRGLVSKGHRPTGHQSGNNGEMCGSCATGVKAAPRFQGNVQRDTFDECGKSGPGCPGPSR